MDKWRAVVDNRAMAWTGVRKTLRDAWIAAGLAVGGWKLCVDCHRCSPAAGGGGWGDVEKLSPIAAVKIPRQDAATAGYPHPPHPYGKDGDVSLLFIPETGENGNVVVEIACAALVAARQREMPPAPHQSPPPLMARPACDRAPASSIAGGDCDFAAY